MARIRTLKPDHRLHRKVGPLSHVAYRLWVGMILEADDEGRLVCSADQLRALAFGYHSDVTAEAVEESLQALHRAELIRLYLDNAVRYAWFPSWHDHQRIDKKQESKLPPYNDSPTIPGTFQERSRLNGMEWKGREGSGKETTSLSGSRPTALRVLEFLNRKTNRHYQPVESNLKLITARLNAGATEDQCRAVIGRKCAKWLGDAKMAEYLRPATLFNATNFAQYQGELPATAFETNGEPDA